MISITSSNHELGCDLEAIAQILEFRHEEELGAQLRQIASKIK